MLKVPSLICFVPLKVISWTMAPFHIILTSVEGTQAGEMAGWKKDEGRRTKEERNVDGGEGAESLETGEKTRCARRRKKSKRRDLDLGEADKVTINSQFKANASSGVRVNRQPPPPNQQSCRPQLGPQARQPPN